MFPIVVTPETTEIVVSLRDVYTWNFTNANSKCVLSFALISYDGYAKKKNGK
jgi:hypothetical protein